MVMENGLGYRIIRRGKSHTLILDRDDPERELEFEVDFQLSLTTRQRFAMMFAASDFLRKKDRLYEDRRSPTIVKRSAR